MNSWPFKEKKSTFKNELSFSLNDSHKLVHLTYSNFQSTNNNIQSWSYTYAHILVLRVYII